jgi:Zn-dependent membrane protease YugP
MPLFFDPTYALYVLIPTLLIGLAAQLYVKAAFARASNVPWSRGRTGAEGAQAVLASAGIDSRIEEALPEDYEENAFGGPIAGGRHDPGPGGAVRITSVGGFLSDHYSPSERTLRLSPEVFSQPTLAAVAVAAHEAGHAIQHKDQYVPLALRSGIVPLVSIGQMVAQIALMVGFFLAGGLHGPLFQVAVAGYALMVLFALVTLPVEFNASRRALAALTSRGLITSTEEPMVRSVLRAAALTYVAAAVTAILHLLYVLSLGRRDEE